MRTFHGISIGRGKGAPSIEDIAIMQGRICRFNGATPKFWPVLLHSLAVADLAKVAYQSEYLELCALLHDAAEVIISDIPMDIKIAKHDNLERIYLKNIYSSLGVPWPGIRDRSKIKAVDLRAGYAECAILGPPNIAEDFKRGIIPSDILAENIVSQYKEYVFDDILVPEGKYVVQYIHRVKQLLAALDEN